jgi:hypothetical protein
MARAGRFDPLQCLSLCGEVAMEARSFPAPWTVEDHLACFIVSDANGQALAHIYYEDEPGRRSAAKLLSKDEARRIAVNFARLPDLLRSQPHWR